MDETTRDGRRRLIKALGAGAVVSTAWETPVIEAQALPLEATASPPPPPPPCEPPREEQTGGSPPPECE